MIRRPRFVLAVTAVSVGLVFLAAWVFTLPLERALVLAPAIVISAGAIVGLLILWGRMAADSLRRRKHPVAIVVGSLAVLALLFVLSFVVGPLPHE